MPASKAAATPDDAIKIAYFVLHKEYRQQDVCEMMGLSNAGRVAEIVVAMRWAAANIDQVYKLAREAKAASKGES